MSSKVSPARGWCLTLNNYTEEEYDQVISQCQENSKKFYYCIGKEVGESGTPHLQGVICAKERGKRWRPFKVFEIIRDGKRVGHWSRMKKCLDANMAYCKKDGEFATNYDGGTLVVQKYERPYEIGKSYHVPAFRMYGRCVVAFTAEEEKANRQYAEAEFTKRLCLKEMCPGQIVGERMEYNMMYGW